MSRVSRLIDQLQVSKDKSCLVTELFPNDEEKDNSISQIAHRVRERLGGTHFLTVKDGVWTLNGYAKTITGEEQNQNEMLGRLERLDKKINRFILGLVICGILVVLTAIAINYLFAFEYTTYD